MFLRLTNAFTHMPVLVNLDRSNCICIPRCKDKANHPECQSVIYGPNDEDTLYVTESLDDIERTIHYRQAQR